MSTRQTSTCLRRWEGERERRELCVPNAVNDEHVPNLSHNAELLTIDTISIVDGFHSRYTRNRMLNAKSFIL